MNLSRLQLFLLYFIFLTSGSSSLISEITWNRMLVLIVGNTVAATSMILVAFMGGLALGSYWGSRTFSKPPHLRPSFLPYSLLEVSIGLYALLSPLLFNLLSTLFTGLAPLFAGSAILSLIRFTITFVSLFAPAFLMGATFPAIIAGAARGSSRKDVSRTGYLYSINTLGATIGCIGAGYILLPRIGVQLTLLWAFAFHIVAAAGGLILNNLAKEREATIDIQPEDRDPLFSGTSFRLLIGIATFLVGFVALSYEVLLTRLIILYFGNQLIVFTLVLASFLLGTGISAVLGTWAQGLIYQISKTGHLFAFVMIIAGLSLVAPPFLLMGLSTTQNTWIIQNHGPLVVIIVLLPTFLMGSLLPIAIKIFQTGLKTDTTFNAGKLYAINTIGGMLGAGITHYFLIPTLGTQGVLSGFSLIFLVVGLSVLLSQGLKRPIHRWAAVSCAVFLGIVLLSLPHKLDELYTHKLTVYSGNDIDPQLKLHYEGRVATATVIDFPHLGFRDMFLNGVEEASTRFGHVQLFKLLGLLPLLVHESDSPKEVLMIAFGAGMTGGSALESGLVSSLDLAELNPDIEEINDLFKEINGDAYHNPRLNFIVEDGRNYLLMNQKKYPVIISDATHPRAYDSWILYTEEFYRLVKDHLTPDGVFAQWVPLSDFSLEMYKILLNTFTKVFPHTFLWSIYGTDQAFLMATPKSFSLDLKRLQQQLDRMPSSLQLKEYQLSRATDIAGFFVMDRETISRFIGDEKRVNTDDLPFNQKYSLKKNTPLRTQSFDQYLADIIPYLKNGDENDMTSVFDRQVLARTMHRFFFFQDPMALDEAFSIRPTDGNILYYKDLESRRMRMASEKLRREASAVQDKIARLKKKIEQSSGNISHSIELAGLYMDMNLIGHAESLIKEALKYSPESIQAHRIMGQIQTARGNWEEAERMFNYVLQHEPQNRSLQESLLLLYAEQKEFQKAIDLLSGMEISDDTPEGSGSQSYQHYMNLAGAYFSIKDFKKAERFLLISLDIYPGNTLARLYLARIYLQDKRHEEAISQLKQILKINPYNKPALTQLIQLYRENGKVEEVKSLEEDLNRIEELP